MSWVKGEGEFVHKDMGSSDLESFIDGQFLSPLNARFSFQAFQIQVVEVGTAHVFYVQFRLGL